MLGDSQQQAVTGSGEEPEGPPSPTGNRKGALGCAAVLLGLAALEWLGVFAWTVWNPLGIDWWPWLLVIAWASPVALAVMAAIVALAAALWPGKQ